MLLSHRLLACNLPPLTIKEVYGDSKETDANENPHKYHKSLYVGEYMRHWHDAIGGSEAHQILSTNHNHDSRTRIFGNDLSGEGGRCDEDAGE